MAARFNTRKALGERNHPCDVLGFGMAASCCHSGLVGQLLGFNAVIVIPLAGSKVVAPPRWLEARSLSGAGQVCRGMGSVDVLQKLVVSPEASTH